jgi:hypothetical protein
MSVPFYFPVWNIYFLTIITLRALTSGSPIAVSQKQQAPASHRGDFAQRQIPRL